MIRSPADISCPPVPRAGDLSSVSDDSSVPRPINQGADKECK